MRKVAVLRSKRLKRKKGMRKVSVKQRGRVELYYRLMEPFMKRNPTCQICEREPSTDCHHCKGRRGNLLFDERWWMALCRRCHDERVHGNVANAKKMEWLVPFWK